MKGLNERPITIATINDFSGGMTGDDRATEANVCTVAKHFDILSRKHRLTPYRSFENGDSTSSTYKVTKFIYYNNKIYGLGVNSGTAVVNVRVNNDITGSTWSDNSNGQDGSGTRSELVFVEYNAGSTTTSYAFGWAGGTRIWKADLSGGGAFVTTEYSPGSTYTNFAQGVVHSKDDCLYMFADNLVFKNNAGIWSAALTLPKKYIISSACEFGDYLAIGCRSLTGNGKSVVYLWNRQTTVNDVSASIDWGTGDLYTLGETEGYLIGGSVVGTALTGLKPRLVFREYVSGTGSKPFQEFICDSIANTISGAYPLSDKQKVSNRLYFLASVVIGGVNCEGVWSIGRTATSTGDFAIHLEYYTNNSETTGLTPSGFALFGDYMFIAYRDGGGAWVMSKTNDMEAYTATSIWESCINPDVKLADRTKIKQVKAVAGSCVPLPSGGTYVVKYKVDGGAYVTVFSQTAAGTVTTEMPVSGVTGGLTAGTELKFRIESTGGVEPTELKYSYETLDNLI